jgi:virginiamycin B lyase
MRLSKILATGAVAIGLGCLWPGAGGAQVLTLFAPDQLTQFNALSLVAGPDGNMWFVGGIDFNTTLSTVGTITPDGQITLFTAGISQGASPSVIVAAQDGNLYFGESALSAIGRITPQGVVTEFSVGAAIQNMVAAPDGSLWFSDDVSTVGRFQLDGTVTLFEIQNPPDPGLGPLTIGPDGNLWVAANHLHALAKASTSGAVLSVIDLPLGTMVNGITNGPDGAVWFTESGAGAIGRVTPDGSLSRFSAGNGSSGLGNIVLGPDGNLWFGEFGTNRIDRITPQGQVTPFLDDNPEEYPAGGIDMSFPTQILGLAPGPQGTGTIWFGTNHAITRLAMPQPTSLAASVLPGGRSVVANQPATVFATMLNSGAAPMTNCHIGLSGAAPSGLQLLYQTTNPVTNALTGQPNQPVTIAGNDGLQTFLIALQSSGPLEQVLMPLDFVCDQASAAILPGIDTVDLAVSVEAASTVPDFIVVSSAPTPGVLHVPVGGSAAFAVAITNAGGQNPDIGGAAVSLNTGIAILPITATLCPTDPATAACLAPAAATAPMPSTPGASATYSVFVSATGPVPLSPALNRITLEIDYVGGTTVSQSLASLALEAH